MLITSIVRHLKNTVKKILNALVSYLEGEIMWEKALKYHVFFGADCYCDCMQPTKNN